MPWQAQTRAIVLAAGAGTRFGGAKVHARFGGRSVLTRVLATLERVGLLDPIVVVGPGAAAVGGATAVVNPDPSQGLASSLQVGWRAATREGTRPQAAIVALGDQPRVRTDVLWALLEAPLDAERPIVAPRYAGSGARNPVRIEVGSIADELIPAFRSGMGGSQDTAGSILPYDPI